MISIFLYTLSGPALLPPIVYSDLDGAPSLYPSTLRFLKYLTIGVMDNALMHRASRSNENMTLVRWHRVRVLRFRIRTFPESFASRLHILLYLIGFY